MTNHWKQGIVNAKMLRYFLIYSRIPHSQILGFLKTPENSNLTSLDHSNTIILPPFFEPLDNSNQFAFPMVV